MKIAKQLLKEFWLPLSATILWTIANLANVTPGAGKFTGAVNIAAPTFFFVSWMTAQYFRVRKQEHVADSLSLIEVRVLEVTERLETQTSKLASLVNARLVQTFDECIDALRDAKEEIADRSRRLKSAPDIDAGEFLLNRGNPLYQCRKCLDMFIGYAVYASSNDEPDLLRERFTRGSYHIEELGGHVNRFIGRLDRQGVSWKTDRSIALLNSISLGIERFELELLAHSRYGTEPYKGGQNLREILKNHVAQLRNAAA